MTTPNPMEDVLRTRRQLMAAAFRDALAEYEMQGVPVRATKADDVLAIAARNHVRAIEAMPPARRPKGWNDDLTSDRGAA